MPNQIQKIIEEFEVRSGFKKYGVEEVDNDSKDFVVYQLNRDWKQEAKNLIKDTFIALLHQEIQELEEMRVKDGWQFAPDRVAGKNAYNKCLDDLITKKKQIISELENND